jgi:RimJ/RimL family protein N-acetyltransferase
VEVWLRPVEPADLEVFFENQLDPGANHMVAFTLADPADRKAFDAHWRRNMANDAVVTRTILADERVAGHVVCFVMDGKPHVGYWIGREFWGQGVATRALTLFLSEVDVRPIYARAAADNIASIRVLQKCGFVQYGADSGFANARGSDVEEVLLSLRSEGKC